MKILNLLKEVIKVSNNYNSELQSNNTDLLAILNSINELPEAGGVDLPELSNPGTAADLLSGKELIDGDGNKVTGTIATKTSANLTASGATVTVPAGYYASQATKSVATGSTKTPATTVTKNPTISVNSSGLITASVSGTQSVTPTVTAGYVSSGTAGTITVSGSATKQLTTQAAKTITPSTSSQTAVASGRYTTGNITVAAIPSNYEDVGAETTQYTSLNTELEEVINSLPSAGGGSGGGGEVKTMNLRLIGTVDSTSGMPSVTDYCFQTYENGEYAYIGSFDKDLGRHVSLNAPFDITIPNVVCNTIAYIRILVPGYWVLEEAVYDDSSLVRTAYNTSVGYYTSELGPIVVEGDGTDRTMYLHFTNDD